MSDFILKACVDDECAECGDAATIVIKSNDQCYYCGNEIPLCRRHFQEFKDQVNEY